MELIKIANNPTKAAKLMAKAIDEGKVIIYPTDTVYGIGCSALNEKAVKKVYRIKKRKKAKPLSVIVKDIDMAKNYCKIGASEKRKLKKYLPGPYTILLKRTRKKIFAILVNGVKRLGIRMPKHSFLTKVMKNLEVPVVTTSANKSGGPSPISISEIPDEVLEKVDYVFDAGVTKVGVPSTVIDLPTGAILRDFRSKK